MPMMPIPKNLYLVHGWQVSDEIRNSMMMEKGEDAMNVGITLTMTMNGKTSFVGRHLGTVDIRNGQEFAGIPIPDVQEQQTLKEIAAGLKLGLQGPPMLYVIEG